MSLHTRGPEYMQSDRHLGIMGQVITMSRETLRPGGEASSLPFGPGDARVKVKCSLDSFVLIKSGHTPPQIVGDWGGGGGKDAVARCT